MVNVTMVYKEILENLGHASLICKGE